MDWTWIHALIAAVYLYFGFRMAAVLFHGLRKDLWNQKRERYQNGLLIFRLAIVFLFGSLISLIAALSYLLTPKKTSSLFGIIVEILCSVSAIIGVLIFFRFMELERGFKICLALLAPIVLFRIGFLIGEKFQDENPTQSGKFVEHS